MATDPFLRIDYSDFNRIKDNFKEYLKTQTVFQDYDFEGSNISVLLDILAYNTYYNAHYLNMVGSEMFFDSAQLKESLVSHSKELNYLPKSRKSAEAEISIQLFPNTTPNKLTIPANQKFTAIAQAPVGGSINVNFYPLQPITVFRNSSGEYISETFTVYEGRYVEEFFRVEMEGENYKTDFVLESDAIDTSTIKVDVFDATGIRFTEINPNIFNRYERADTLFGLTPDSQVYFIQGHRANKYQIYFGNDITGKRLNTRNLVRVTYLDTVGEEGNNLSNFSSPTIQGVDSEVTTITPSRYGKERESIESIKLNAPRHFQTQERAVTSRDYETLVKNNFGIVQAVIAYGGEQTEPKQYGKVIIAVKPFGTEALVNQNYKDQIQNFLKLRNLTTEAIVTDPEFFYIEINSKIYYDLNNLSISLGDLTNQISSKLVSFNDDVLNDFGKDLYYSQLIQDINETNEGILTNDTSLRMIRIWSPTVNEDEILNFSYDNTIFNYTLLENNNLFSEFPSSFISSEFIYTTKENELVTAFMKDDANGSIYIYTIGSNGREVILQRNVGTINYTNGNVSIKANITNYDGEIRLYAKTLNKDILATSNKFLIIRGSDVQLELINRTRLDKV